MFTTQPTLPSKTLTHTPNLRTQRLCTLYTLKKGKRLNTQTENEWNLRSIFQGQVSPQCIEYRWLEGGSILYSTL